MNTSSKDEICKEIRISIGRLACSPQRWDQLCERLADEEQQTVVEAILCCLGELPEDDLKRQTFLHGLLVALQPRPSINLEEMLRRLLPNWNINASDLPIYLYRAFGTDCLYRTLDQIGKATEDLILREKTGSMRRVTRAVQNWIKD